MNGLEVAQRVALLRLEMRVLYMSGYTGGTGSHRRIRDVRSCFLQKPFALATLGKKVREVLEAPP